MIHSWLTCTTDTLENVALWSTVLIFWRPFSYQTIFVWTWTLLLWGLETLVFRKGSDALLSKMKNYVSWWPWTHCLEGLIISGNWMIGLGSGYFGHRNATFFTIFLLFISFFVFTINFFRFTLKMNPKTLLIPERLHNQCHTKLVL